VDVPLISDQYNQWTVLLSDQVGMERSGVGILNPRLWNEAHDIDSGKSCPKTPLISTYQGKFP
jgi:hypothetical protein